MLFRSSERELLKVYVLLPMVTVSPSETFVLSDVSVVYAEAALLPEFIIFCKFVNEASAFAPINISFAPPVKTVLKVYVFLPIVTVSLLLTFVLSDVNTPVAAGGVTYIIDILDNFLLYSSSSFFCATIAIWKNQMFQA